VPLLALLVEVERRQRRGVPARQRGRLRRAAALLGLAARAALPLARRARVVAPPLPILLLLLLVAAVELLRRRDVVGDVGVAGACARAAPLRALRVRHAHERLAHGAALLLLYLRQRLALVRALGGFA
jgi:hypothetical protein